MAKLMTYSQAISRFANLATTGIGIEEAIQEAVDRIYEMGRWPGTTVEIELAEADFIAGDNDHEWFVYFPEETYDGAVGFRNNHRGWSIVDHASLYRDGINAGDREFLDMGTVDYLDGTLTVSGTLTDGTDPIVFPVLYPIAGFNGSLGTFAFSSDGAEASPFDGVWYGLVADSGGEGRLVHVVSTFTENSWSMASPPNLADPLSWTLTPDSPATGIPVLSMTTVKKRKYRAPLGFCPDQGPYFALMKLEAPVLEDDTVIPIHSAGALKTAILAVCQEYVNDDDRAMLNWQKFDSFITKAAKQVDGPKRWSIGMDSSLRRKPTQFL